LQYEIDLVQCTQRNVMTGYVRRLLRRDLAQEAAHQLQKSVRGSQQRARYLQTLDAARTVIACMQRMCARKQFFTLFRATHKLQLAVRRSQQRSSYLQEGDAARSEVESLRSEREPASVGGEGSAEKGDSSCCSCCCCC
jgi:myosin heavy subunit